LKTSFNQSILSVLANFSKALHFCSVLILLFGLNNILDNFLLIFLEFQLKLLAKLLFSTKSIAFLLITLHNLGVYFVSHLDINFWYVVVFVVVVEAFSVLKNIRYSL